VVERVEGEGEDHQEEREPGKVDRVLAVLVAQRVEGFDFGAKAAQARARSVSTGSRREWAGEKPNVRRSVQVMEEPRDVVKVALDEIPYRVPARQSSHDPVNLVCPRLRDFFRRRVKVDW
jgi:hypothetical protein